MNILPLSRKQTSVVLFAAMMPALLLANFTRKASDIGGNISSIVIQEPCHAVFFHGIFSAQHALRGKTLASHIVLYGPPHDCEFGHATTTRTLRSIERHARTAFEPLHLLLLSTQIFSAHL